MARTLLLVALGGGIGSVFRYLTAVFVNKFFSGAFPLATFITNILGCFLIGIFMGYLAKSQFSNPDLKWLFVTGFCGGYTTFSAFGFENVTLLQGNQSATAFLYIGLSIITGLSAVWLGLFVTR